MSFLSDPYATYVLGSYGATAVILGGLVWSTVRSNRRAREALDEVEARRNRGLRS